MASVFDGFGGEHREGFFGDAVVAEPGLNADAAVQFPDMFDRVADFPNSGQVGETVRRRFAIEFENHRKKNGVGSAMVHPEFAG